MMDSPDLDLDALLIEGQAKRRLLRQPTKYLSCTAVVAHQVIYVETVVTAS